MRVTRLENISEQEVTVELVNGAKVGLPPKASLTNADVVNVDSLKGRVSLTEDLTEINQATGKTRING